MNESLQIKIRVIELDFGRKLLSVRFINQIYFKKILESDFRSLLFEGRLFRCGFSRSELGIYLESDSTMAYLRLERHGSISIDEHLFVFIYNTSSNVIWHYYIHRIESGNLSASFKYDMAFCFIYYLSY